MRYRKCCLAACKSLKGLLDHELTLCIQTCGCFIQDKYTRIWKDSSCYSNTLSLTTRKSLSCFASGCVISIRKLQDEFLTARHTGRCFNLFIRSIWISQSYILKERTSEEEVILSYSCLSHLPRRAFRLPG